MWARTDPDPAAAPQLSDDQQLLEAPATLGAGADAVPFVLVWQLCYLRYHLLGLAFRVLGQG